MQDSAAPQGSGAAAPEPAQASGGGGDLRALGKARGLTLAALTLKVGRSVGWLSRVERNPGDVVAVAVRVVAPPVY